MNASTASKRTWARTVVPVDQPLPHGVMAFPLDLLAGARINAQPLDVCAAGHLVVRGRGHYRPLKFTADFKSVVCARAEHAEPTHE